MSVWSPPWSVHLETDLDLPKMGMLITQASIHQGVLGDYSIQCFYIMASDGHLESSPFPP